MDKRISRLDTSLLAVAGISAAALGLAAWGRLHWARSTRVLLARLEASRRPPTVLRYEPQELAGLPAPVQRYFQAVLTPGQAIVTGVSVAHAGHFNASLRSEQWRPFTSRQQVSTSRPGFVWDASIQMWPGLAVRVHDAYLAGTGVLEPALLGCIPLGRQPSDPRFARALALGELLRYLAESAWYPTALLPSQGVQWQAVDEHSADATLHDGELSVTMRVAFDGAGLIESVHVEARGAVLGQTLVEMPWEGCWTHYQPREGMLVPLSGEAAWITPQGRRPYWRGSITSLAYQLAST